MVRNAPFTPRRRFSLLFNPVMLLVLSSVGALLWAYGCEDHAPPQAAAFPGAEQGEVSGEAFLLSALEEIEQLGEFSLRAVPGLSPGYDALAGSLPGATRKRLLRTAAADTTYIYGELTPGGFGAVVTERHTYPKGLPLITVRRSYGTPAFHVVTETKRYTSHAAFLSDSAEQSNVTEIYGLSSDTIVTHVVRNGLLETFTFRLPVVTRVTDPQDGSVRVTSRYGDSGAVVSEVRDGGGILQLLRRTSGAADGAIVNATYYPDSTWRSTRTLGQPDGSVLREITSGP